MENIQKAFKNKFPGKSHVTQRMIPNESGDFTDYASSVHNDRDTESSQQRGRVSSQVLAEMTEISPNIADYSPPSDKDAKHSIDNKNNNNQTKNSIFNHETNDTDVVTTASHASPPVPFHYNQQQQGQTSPQTSYIHAIASNTSTYHSYSTRPLTPYDTYRSNATNATNDTTNNTNNHYNDTQTTTQEETETKTTSCIVNNISATTSNTKLKRIRQQSYSVEQSQNNQNQNQNPNPIQMNHCNSNPHERSRMKKKRKKKKRMKKSEKKTLLELVKSLPNKKDRFWHYAWHDIDLDFADSSSEMKNNEYEFDVENSTKYILNNKGKGCGYWFSLTSEDWQDKHKILLSNIDQPRPFANINNNNNNNNNNRNESNIIDLIDSKQNELNCNENIINPNNNNNELELEQEIPSQSLPNLAEMQSRPSLIKANDNEESEHSRNSLPGAVEPINVASKLASSANYVSSKSKHSLYDCCRIRLSLVLLVVALILFTVSSW